MSGQLLIHRAETPTGAVEGGQRGQLGQTVLRPRCWSCLTAYVIEEPVNLEKFMLTASGKFLKSSD